MKLINDLSKVSSRNCKQNAGLKMSNLSRLVSNGLVLSKYTKELSFINS